MYVNLCWDQGSDGSLRQRCICCCAQRQLELSKGNLYAQNFVNTLSSSLRVSVSINIVHKQAHQNKNMTLASLAIQERYKSCIVHYLQQIVFDGILGYCCSMWHCTVAVPLSQRWRGLPGIQRLPAACWTATGRHWREWCCRLAGDHAAAAVAERVASTSLLP